MTEHQIFDPEAVLRRERDEALKKLATSEAAREKAEAEREGWKAAADNRVALIDERDAALASNAALRSALEPLRKELFAYSPAGEVSFVSWGEAYELCHGWWLQLDAALRDTSGAEVLAEMTRRRGALQALRDAAVAYAVHHGPSPAHEVYPEERCPEADEPSIGSPPCAGCLLDHALQAALEDAENSLGHP